MSLSLRLFGNIFGEDTLLAVFALLGVVVIAFIPGIGDQWWMPGVARHLPFRFLSMLLGLIQALVFFFSYLFSWVAMQVPLFRRIVGVR